MTGGEWVRTMAALAVVAVLVSEIAFYGGLAWRYRDQWSISDVFQPMCLTPPR